MSNLLLSQCVRLARFLRKPWPEKIVAVRRRFHFRSSTSLLQRQVRLIPREICASRSCKIVFTSGTAPRYNGGVKLYNLWTQLLKKHGYDAYIATVDGQYEQWLVNHQPVISYKEVKQMKQKGYSVRVVTGWLDTPHLERLVDDGQFYYFDAELKWTLHFREKLDYFLKRNMIAEIATHSRYIQGWYMAEYGIRPILINEWSDTAIFYPKPEVRVPGRIGCIVESTEDEEIYQFVHRKCMRSKLSESIIKIAGDERTVADAMRTVDIFVGLNQGKHPLWGEGCPRAQQEAMHCGCVVVAFDVLGNREYLYHRWTGLLVPPGDLEGLWNAIEFLLQNEVEKERLRANSLRLVQALFSESGKFELVSHFLRLDGLTKKDLDAIFPKPFWLNEHEIPALAKYAASVKGNIVEIGCAYGGSTVVFLLNMNPDAHLYSIDAFVPDSMGGFCAHEYECRNAVREALRRMKRPDLLKKWTLLKRYSHDVVKQWDKKIGLLFIDGSHHYDDVKRDFQEWSPFVLPNGFILLHDSRREESAPEDIFARGWPGPTQLADELRSHRCVELIDEVFSLTVWRRTGLPCPRCSAGKG
ncbi:MAG: class I SAM-dependent methyltransferase [Candidatus Methanomethyliaceae archaeon]